MPIMEPLHDPPKANAYTAVLYVAAVAAATRQGHVHQQQ